MNEEITSERLTKQIILFRDFLVKSWDSFDNLMENHDWDNDMDFSDDWIQVNWEFLVERELLGEGKYLTPLCTPLISRVLSNNDQFDFSVVTCLEKDLIDVRDGKTILKGTRLRLIGFSSKTKTGGFGLYPPFDIALLVIDKKRKEIVWLSFKDLKFHLEIFNPNYFKKFSHLT